MGRPRLDAPRARQYSLQPSTIRMVWRIWRLVDADPAISVRALTARLNLSTTSMASYYLRILERWGVIKQPPRLSRARTILIPYNQWLGD